MYIQELYLENFRGFKELTLKFPTNLAVLIGINGSGKSSILDAIAILLSQFESRLRKANPRMSGTGTYNLTEDDININSNETRISIKIEFTPNSNVSWTISRNRDSVNSKVTTKELSAYIKNILESLELNPLVNLPALVYYQTHRMVLSAEASEINHPLTKPIRRVNQLNAYQKAFSSRINDFQDFFDWFREEEDYENEVRLRENESYRNPNIEIVRAAITRFLDNFPNSKFSNLHVVRSITNRELGIRRSMAPSLTITKNGQDLKLEKLSDGEKMLLMLVTDLARRLAILNPSVDDPAQALDGNGIVLIDEIDLHLHPQWQRIVITSLIKTFKNCQFIVTTHSPQVLSRVHKENVFMLEDTQLIESTPYTFGRDNNTILYELMGVPERPIEVKQKLDECFQLIDDEKIEEAKIAIDKLSELLGEDDPEIVRAYTLIDFFNRVI